MDASSVQYTGTACDGAGIQASAPCESSVAALGAPPSSLATPGGEEPFGTDAAGGFADAAFRAKKKHSLREVAPPEPALEHVLSDTHVHLAMLRDPARALARAAVHRVGFLCCISDPTGDADVVYSQIDEWARQAADVLPCIAPDVGVSVPHVRIACGCHPHEARLYDDAVEARLVRHLKDPRTCCVGEIGLDYHYDHSPRPVQRDVFARQLRLAHETGLPVSLHLREAHDDALDIMDDIGFPEAGVILHCFNLGPDELAPWVQRGCYVAVGGAVTFASSDALRQALPRIPRNRLLFETDGPYMAPAPFRGCECGSDHVVFTAARIAAELGIEPGPLRKDFLSEVFANAVSLLDRKATPWQNER